MTQTPEEINEELKATIREARGMIKDMREHIQNLAELNIYTRELIERNVDELLAVEVKKGLATIAWVQSTTTEMLKPNE